MTTAEIHDTEKARCLLEALRQEIGDGASPRAKALLDALEKWFADFSAEAQDCGIVLGVLERIARHRPPENALTEVLRFLTDRLELGAGGIRLREGRDFPYYATTGFSDDFVAAERSLCSRRDPNRLECFCGAVIRGEVNPRREFFTPRGSFWTNHSSELVKVYREDPQVASARGRCQADGYESVVLIPLRSGQETFGLLQFNDREAGKFSPHTVDLLEEMAEYLSELLV